MRSVRVARIRWGWLHSDRFDDWLEPKINAAWFEWIINREGKIADWLDAYILARLCAHDEAERDHCGMPAHDLCRGCGKRMPGMAPRRGAS